MRSRLARVNAILKEINRFLMTPYKNLSKADQKLWEEGADRLLAELRRRKKVKIQSSKRTRRTS